MGLRKLTLGWANGGKWSAWGDSSAVLSPPAGRVGGRSCGSAKAGNRAAGALEVKVGEVTGTVELV